MTEAQDGAKPKIETFKELTTGRTVEELVAEYNQVVRLGTETIIEYFRNYNKVGQYIGLNREAGGSSFHNTGDVDITSMMQSHVNTLLDTVRHDFWRRTLDLKEVRQRLTSKKRAEFKHQVRDRCNMDFTEHNIRQFVLNLMAGHEKTLTEAVVDIFDMFTIRHTYDKGLNNDNIHYFNGWKTNKAFRVNKRLVIPIYAGYGDHGPFQDYSKRWKLDYQAAAILSDIDIVMNYFDGMGWYDSMSNALERYFAKGISSKIQSTYFTMTVYKKGTIHLMFNDENILRRFNVAACLGKGWLPFDYGRKTYEESDPEERLLIESFEGKASYELFVGKPLFGPNIEQKALPEPELQGSFF